MNLITGIILYTVLALNAVLCLRIIFTLAKLNPPSKGWLIKLPHHFKNHLVVVKLFNRR